MKKPRKPRPYKEPREKIQKTKGWYALPVPPLFAKYRIGTAPKGCVKTSATKARKALRSL